MFSHIVVFWTDPVNPNAADEFLAGANKLLKKHPRRVAISRRQNDAKPSSGGRAELLGRAEPHFSEQESAGRLSGASATRRVRGKICEAAGQKGGGLRF
jgi:hypothetical protein